jgi:hypothetical protein
MQAMLIFASRSASSTTMSADLPPSSRKRRFIVAPPFSKMRLPVAVEPVKEMRSTSGLVVSSSPTRWSDDVTTLNTPAGMSVFSATRRPSRVAFHGVSGGLGMTFAVARPGRSSATTPRTGVPRHDGADDAGGLATQHSGGRRRRGCRGARAPPLEGR